MPLADFTLGDALLTVVEIFLFVLYFWMLITIIGDLFRDHQLSGWAKAGWILVLFVVPFLGMLIYAKLSELKDKGAISDAEFERAKAKLLA